jgi:hypothetical protein
MTTIGAYRVVQAFRLSEEPGSPEFSLAYTEENLGRWARGLSGIEKAAQAAEDKDDAKALFKVLADGVSLFIGSDKCSEIVAWLSDGVKPEDCVIPLSDVFAACCEEYHRRIADSRAKRLADLLLDDTAKPDTL